MPFPPEIEAVVYGANRAETQCPGCGLYVGPVERCPACGGRAPKRWPIRALKYGSPVLALAGLFALVAFARAAGDPEVKIERLDARMNFARVRIRGKVAGPPRLYESRSGSEDAAGSLQFMIDDGTGILRVRSYDAVTRELMQAGKVPAMGDEVAVVAPYQHRAQGDLLLLDSALALTLQREEPAAARPLGDVVRTADRKRDEGKRVRLTGRVSGPPQFGVGNVRFRLEDPLKRRISVHCPEDMLKLYGAATDARHWGGIPSSGEYLSVTGALDYDDFTRQWILLLASPGDLRPADEATWKADNLGK
ncbi:MAG: hypothetical protein HYZ53_28305 [Planctomycetes bacterium]|nr:hypothetical protein [Planctomycetota bacterium]